MTLKRNVCTSENPMPKGDKGLWSHPYAVDTGRDSAYYDYYHCPICKENFKVEVPE